MQKSSSYLFANLGKKWKNPTLSAKFFYIYCPRGTKGIYTEPYSDFGTAKRAWDGKSKLPVKNEVEVILQRGAKMSVIRAEYKDGMWFVDMEVIGQYIP